jgi:DNA-binding MarR family transcriptional regulator
MEQISPQSMGATLSALERRGLIDRCPDPADGRQSLVSASPSGLQVLRSRRDARTERLAAALSKGFTGPELQRLMAAAPLVERLAQSI